MPAALKAWFDQVIRIRRTFSFDRNEKTWPLSPLMSGKTLVLLSASGEFVNMALQAVASLAPKLARMRAS